MKYSATYSSFFFNDLAVATDHLSQFSATASARFKSVLRDRIEKIKAMPDMYSILPFTTEYRHIVIQKYVVIYRVDEKEHTVLLYRLLHGSQDIPRYL